MERFSNNQQLIKRNLLWYGHIFDATSSSIGVVARWCERENVRGTSWKNVKRMLNLLSRVYEMRHGDVFSKKLGTKLSNLRNSRKRTRNLASSSDCAACYRRTSPMPLEALTILQVTSKAGAQ